MKKRYDETNGEIVFEDVAMAATLMGDYFDEQGKRQKGLQFLRVQDTPFPDTKEIVLKKEKSFDSLIQLYFNKKIRIEPHEYLNLRREAVCCHNGEVFERESRGSERA